MQEQEIDELMQRLHEAFAGGEGSFLLDLRERNAWSQPAFVQLVKDMRVACEVCAGEELLERWMADGFWYLPSFVQSWTSHPDFPRAEMPIDQRLATGLLEDLAHWFFTSECPWEDPDGWLASHLSEAETSDESPAETGAEAESENC